MRRYYVHFHEDTAQDNPHLVIMIEADFIATMSKESFKGSAIGYDYTFLINDDDLGTIIVAVFPTDKVDYIVSEEIPGKVDGDI